MHCLLLLSRNAKAIKMVLSGNIGGSFPLDQNMLCVNGLSKGCNSRITEYINLQFTGNYDGDD